MPTNKKVLIVLAEGFEETEAVLPIDILRRANIDVKIAGLSGLEIKGSHGIKVMADTGLDDIKDDFDALMLPGGSPGAENLSKSEKLKAMVKEMYKNGKIIAAICASPAVVLGAIGILDGKKATCYSGMEKMFPSKAHYVDEEVVTDGNLVTSKGPATAHLLGFKLVEMLVGKATAESLMKKMLFT